MSGATRNVSWESLLGSSEAGKLAERLVYFDLEGHKYNGQTTSGASLDEALKLVGRSTKAIRRSTGGLVIAEPFQLLVYGEEDSQSQDPSQIRIRVRFRDFKRTGNRVTAAEYVTHTKTVLAEDLHEPFTVEASGESQRFILDFGDGTVPIHIFHANPKENSAFFIELADLEKLKLGRPGSRVTLPVYQVALDVVRMAPDDAMRGPYEYQLAVGNYLRLRQDGRRIIPEALKVGTIAVPAGLTPPDTQRALEVALAKQLKPAEQPCFQLDEEEGLKPFGTFER